MQENCSASVRPRMVVSTRRCLSLRLRLRPDFHRLRSRLGLAADLSVLVVSQEICGAALMEWLAIIFIVVAVVAALDFLKFPN